MPGRQVGNGGGGGAWEEFDCDEALSDLGEKAWGGFIHPLSHPSIQGGEGRMNRWMRPWMKYRMNILSEREDAVFAKQRERVIR